MTGATEVRLGWGNSNLSLEKPMMAISYDVDLSDLGDFVFKYIKL
jgi:hypothetical protein